MPLVGWLTFVFVASAALVPIVKGTVLAVAVLVVVVYAGGLGYVGHAKGAGRMRTWCITVGGLLVCGAVLAAAMSGIGEGTVASPPRPSPSIPPTEVDAQPPITSSATPTSTTATNAPAPAAGPPRPFEEKAIPVGSVGEFYDHAVIIGANGAYTTWSALTISTDVMGCPNSNLNVGERAVFAGKRDGAKDFFRVTLLKSVDNVSATVRVEELPSEAWPSSATCPI